jgi:hypothetical protein
MAILSSIPSNACVWCMVVGKGRHSELVLVWSKEGDDKGIEDRIAKRERERERERERDKEREKEREREREKSD